MNERMRAGAREWLKDQVRRARPQLPCFLYFALIGGGGGFWLFRPLFRWFAQHPEVGRAILVAPGLFGLLWAFILTVDGVADRANGVEHRGAWESKRSRALTTAGTAGLALLLLPVLLLPNPDYPLTWNAPEFQGYLVGVWIWALWRGRVHWTPVENRGAWF